MTTSQYISVRETSQMLGISEGKVMELVQEQKLRAYYIADQFLRLKREEVLEIKNAGRITAEILPQQSSKFEKLSDFFYFNDFYILASGIIALLLYTIFAL